MANQIVLGIFFLAFVAGGMAATGRASKICTAQEDCDPFWECCAKRIFTNTSYCVKRRLMNQFCMEREYFVNGVYDITCPCVSNLKCIKDSYFSDEGTFIRSFNPRCRPPDYVPPPLEERNPYSDINDSSYSLKTPRSARSKA